MYGHCPFWLRKVSKLTESLDQYKEFIATTGPGGNKEKEKTDRWGSLFEYSSFPLTVPRDKTKEKQTWGIRSPYDASTNRFPGENKANEKTNR